MDSKQVLLLAGLASLLLYLSLHFWASGPEV